MVEEVTYENKSTLAVLLGEVLHSKDFAKCKVILYDSGILHYQMAEGQMINFSDISETRNWAKSHYAGKFLVMIEAGLKTEFDDDLQIASASKNGYDGTIADAFVVKSLSQRILANFYLRFKKPVRPTRIFSDAESAAFWLMSFR